MEEDMVEVEYTFTAYEIDLDYEFDAARFFDFAREESPLEARQVEAWFDSAGSYPPSPFLARLVPRKEILFKNVNISPSRGGMENKNLFKSDNDVGTDCEISSMGMLYGDEECRNKGTSSDVLIEIPESIQDQSQKLPSGLTSYNQMVNDVNSKNQSKLSVKPTYRRTSTLMKPTMSHLAKQNRALQTEYSRSLMFELDKSSKTSTSTCMIENQAAKRQKLEGGLLRKVGTMQLPLPNFVHKAPKQDKLLCGIPTPMKPRITIPREPDLETARRARRTMESSKDVNVNSTARRFKALPLNKKILETPLLLPKRSTPCIPDFQEFHLKTSERAMEHRLAVLKSVAPLSHPNKESHKYSPILTNERRREPERTCVANTALNSDGALALNKERLTSKGDIGVFQNSKKEATVPMELNFQSEIMFRNNPPVELFNKLSLAAETQPAANTGMKGP